MGTGTTLRRTLSAALAAASVGALSAPAHACGSSADCSFAQVCDTNTANCVAAPPDSSSPSAPSDQRAGWAAALGGIGTGLSVFGLIFAAKMFDDLRAGGCHTYECWSGTQIGLYTAGGVLAGMGAVSIVLRATVPDPCEFKSLCQATYGLGATSAAVGGLMLAEGIWMSANPPALRGTAWITPVPVVIPTLRGPTVGLGITGWNL